MYIQKAISFPLFLALVAGCKINSHHEVFISELRDISSGNQAQGELQSIFRTSLPTSERCERYRPLILKIFAKYHDKVSTGECVVSGKFVDLTFTAATPLVRLSADPIPGTNIFALAVQPGQKPGTVHLFATQDLRRLAHLQMEIRAIDFDASRETITIEQVTVVLNNDTGGTVRISAPSAFVNREPELVVAADIARRSRLELRLSDVSVAQLGRSGQVFIGIVGN